MSTPDLKSRRAKLSPIQYAVTQEGRTEPPFTGAYWDEHGVKVYDDGVYTVYRVNR